MKMLFPMPSKIFFFLMLIFIQACQNDNKYPIPIPSDQQELISELAEIKRNYSSVNETKNDLKIENVENQMRTLLTSIQGKNAENWIGQVKDVTSGFLESIWITTAVDNVEFHLYPDDKDKAKNFVSNLNQGDWVLYSGVIDGESSLTISGAIDVCYSPFLRPQKVIS